MREASGLSRAAKKRAKKRQKQKQQQETTAKEEEDPTQEDEQQGENDQRRKKKKQKREHNHGSPKTIKTIGDSRREETAAVLGEKKAADTDSELDESGQDGEIESIVSKLSPAQILLLRDVNEKDVQDIDVQDVQELLQNEISSTTRSRCLLQSILGPKNAVQDFYNDYWEKKPLLVQDCADKDRFQPFLSLASIRTLLEKETLCYGRDLNVTRYDTDQTTGQKRRVTLDLLSNSDDFVAADSKDVWSNYDSGCTLRLLCPQLHFDAIHTLLSTLELEWSCMVGANAYLTPPQSSQGFAPHYGDIEAFVLQVEGYKQWKVYPPPNRAETLPRMSSRDFTQDELTTEPVLDVTLGPGDLLYMPRGWIHQACTAPSKEHSLHLTVSAMQTWAWADLLELLLPEALEAAAQSETSTSLREGLPRNFLNYMGIIHSTNEDEDNDENTSNTTGKDGIDSGVVPSELRKRNRLREQFREEAKKRIMRVCKEAMSMIDGGCDQIGKRFLSDRLPPALMPNESSLTNENTAGGKIWPNTLCRLVRPGIARLALEDEKAVLYHCVDNSRVYQGNPLSPMEFEMDDAPALEALLTTTEPHWIQVQDLAHNDIEDKMAIAQALYDEGILAVLQSDAPDKSVQVG